MHCVKKTVVIVFSTWLLAFIGLTIASYDAGNSGEDGWSVSWGYPTWVGFQSSDLASFPRELEKGQIAFIHGFIPKQGSWYFDGIALLLSLTIPFTPIALGFGGYELFRNNYRFHISTLIVFALACGVLMALNIPKISEAEWTFPSGLWPWIWSCGVIVFPSISAAITLCFLVRIVREKCFNRWEQNKPN